MRPKLYRGENDSGYAKRRLAEIRKAQNPYPALRAGLQDLLAVLTLPQPLGRRLVRGR